MCDYVRVISFCIIIIIIIIIMFLLSVIIRPNAVQPGLLVAPRSLAYRAFTVLLVRRPSNV